MVTAKLQEPPTSNQPIARTYCTYFSINSIVHKYVMLEMKNHVRVFLTFIFEALTCDTLEVSVVSITHYRPLIRYPKLTRCDLGAPDLISFHINHFAAAISGKKGPNTNWYVSKYNKTYKM